MPGPWEGYGPRKRRLVEGVLRAVSRANTWIYRRTRGRLGAKFLGGADICLLTVIGRKSGLERTVPLLYLREGERVIVVASKGGDCRHPIWYLNLLAKAEVRVQIGAELLERRARTASAEEKAEIWPRLVASYAGYAHYQASTSRDIPVVFLEPR